MEAAVAAPPIQRINEAVIRLLREDITELEVDAFVYYAQPELSLGSGFGGAIAVRGGASIQKELNGLVANGPVPPGEAVITGAGKLKAQFIIHAVGPRFRELNAESKLLKTMMSCLALAEEKGVKSLAFPLMGSGYYGIPPTVSARVMLEALSGHLAGTPGIREVIICVFDTPQFNAVEAAMAAKI